MPVMLTPEEMQMMETQRRLRKLGYSDDMDKLIDHATNDRLLPVKKAAKLPPTVKKVPNEKKDTKTEETPFPGEFSPLRIPG